MPNPRFDARSRVIWSTASTGARLLYLALDDMARDRGTWFIKQSELSIKLGIGDRHLRRHIAELAARGLLSCERTGTSSLFTLLWIKTADRTQMADQEGARSDTGGRSDRPYMADRSSRFLISSSTKDPGRRSNDPAAIELMIEILLGYPGARNLSGVPDEEIAIRCLNAGGWNLDAIGDALVFLHKTKRAAPRQSWAWFATVLANHFTERRTA